MISLLSRPKAALFLLALLYSASWSALAIDMKVDRVQVNTPVGGSPTWTSVTFQQAFTQVPVVIVTPTNENTDPATVRIRNVTTTGFEALVAEPEGSDGATAAMNINYFAAEPGSYTFAGAVRLDVFLYATSTQQGRYIGATGWNTIAFGASFSTAPAVVTQVQSANSTPTVAPGSTASPFLEVAVRNVNASTMEMALERAETSTLPIATEVIGYMAMESGDQFSLDGATVRALRTSNNIRGWGNGCFTTNFASAFGSAPLAVAGQNTRAGGDGGWVRQCSISASNIGLTIDEDVANDTDRNHTNETAGVLAASQAFHGTRNGRHIEAGSAVIPSSSNPTQWTTVSFPNAFSVTPRIFTLPTDEVSTPAALRLRNITTNGFDIAAVSPSGSVAPPGQMEVDYVAIIPGEHTMPGGAVFEVGSIDTSNYQAGTGGSTGTVDINFVASHGGIPAVLLQIQSNNNEPTLDPNSVSEPWMVTASTSVTASRARVALERAEAPTGTISAAETIAYFVVEDGANGELNATDNSLINYETFVTPDSILGWTEGCRSYSYADSYVTPHVVSTQFSRDGNNGGWVRRCSLNGTSVELLIDEDQYNDSERSHTTEEASVFVFSQAFEADFNAIDYYAIFHGGTGVTCEASTITIAARDSTGFGLDVGARTITVTATSVSPGWDAGDVTWSLAAGYTGTFSTSGAQAEYTFDSGESAVELQLANTSEAVIDIDVVDNDPAYTDREGTIEDPDITFEGNGLRFYNDADADGDADGNDAIESQITAGTASGQWILRAVQTNDLSGACEARVTGVQSVDIAYECVDPMSCIRDDDAEINDTAIADNDFAAALTYNSVSLTFDAEGEAPIRLEYFDVGEIQLHAQLDLPASGGNPAVTLEGTSAFTTSRPASIVISAIEDAGGTANPGSAGASTGDGFVPANTAFTVEAQVQNSVGGLTPNFGNEISPETLALEAVNLVMPSTGSLPALLNASAFTPTATAGEFRNTQVRFREAGTITMRARLLDSNYMGTGDLVGAESGNVGRFYPANLTLTTQSVTNGCDIGAFTYMSDAAQSYTPIDLAVDVEAVSATGVRLQNYDDTYPVADLAFVAENVDAGSDIIGRWNIPDFATATWENGLYDINGTDNAGFSRNTVLGSEQPDGPYFDIALGIRVEDAEDNENFDGAALDMNATTTGDCSLAGNCNAATLGNIAAYYGRLALGNAHGPATAPLSVLFETQVWDATEGFQTHTLDSCTAISMADIQFDGSALSTDTNRNVTVGGGTSTGSFSSFIAGTSTTAVNGDFGLNFSAPGAGNNGSFFVDVDLTNLPWLRSDWNQDGNAANDTALPSGDISFGSYRGHDRILYWREVLR